MAADIHFHSEIKISGRWHHYSYREIDRWRDLFSVMADYRNASMLIPISEPKGLPNDMSFETLFFFEYEKGDAKSCSWLDQHEIKILAGWVDTQGYNQNFNEIFGFLFGNSWANFSNPEYREQYPPELEDIRFVFWFDN